MHLKHYALRCFSSMILDVAVLAPPLAADLSTHAELTDALKGVVGTGNGGFELNMWATVVDRDGAVHAVTFSGNDRGEAAASFRRRRPMRAMRSV